MPLLSTDQYRFIMSNVAGLSLAAPYDLVPKSIRNEYHYLPGVLMVYYCFGHHANSLILFSLVSFLICKYAPLRNVQLVTLINSLAFLSYAHLSRQIIDYGGYVLDISGPFMIAVQKIISLGFSMHDGYYLKKIKKEKSLESEIEELNDGNNNNDSNNNDGNLITDVDGVLPLKSASPQDIKEETELNKKTSSGTTSQKFNDRIINERRKYAIHARPKFNEFMGYFFHFPTVLCGPLIYYGDYCDFVNAPENFKRPPGRFKAVAKKLGISVTAAILHLFFSATFDAKFFRTTQFLLETPLILRFGHIIALTSYARLKYYVAWHLGEALTYAEGFGYNGKDENGKHKWDLVSTMDLFKFETCLSMRDSIHAWNKTTQTWLRQTAYERVPRKFSVLSTYTLSAIWHGFYPGYYMTFLSGAIFTMAARNGRRIVRPMFQKGPVLSTTYDIITFILTRLTIAYAAFPFVILDFHSNLEIYKSLYFSFHLLAMGGILLGFFVKKSSSAATSRI